MASAIDVLTLDEGRAALRQGSSVTSDDGLIAAWITAVSIRLDASDGVGPIVSRIITDETHDGGGSYGQLDHRPALSISAVTEDTTALTAAQYHLDTEKSLLYRQDGEYDDYWCAGRDNIKTTYTAGRYASTELVDEFFKRGATLLLKHLWRSEQWNAQGITTTDFDVPQVAYPAFGIPNAVVEWFGSSWRGRKGGFA